MILQDPVARETLDVARLQNQGCFNGLKLLDVSAAKLFFRWVPRTTEHSAFLAQVGSLFLLNFVSRESLKTAFSLKGSSQGELC